MATKPVKVLTDLLTKKQIIKQDSNNNVLFNVSGTLENGHVSSSLPITASYFVGDGRYLTNISASGGGGISSVSTTGSITGSGLIANPISLKDPLVINTVTASVGFSGNLYGTASFANTSSYAINAGLSTVTTSGSITGSGVVENPITLKDPLVIGTVTASLGFSGNLYGTASYANSASFSVTASYSINALTASAIAGNATISVQNAYKRLRYQIVGNFDVTGSAIIVLPSSSLGSNAFPTGSFDYINVSVAIKDDNRWINDLLSVQMYTSSTNIYIELSAPALTNIDQYKLIAINENPIDYVVI
jgi:hypothetical protein